MTLQELKNKALSMLDNLGLPASYDFDGNQLSIYVETCPHCKNEMLFSTSHDERNSGNGGYFLDMIVNELDYHKVKTTSNN